MLYKYKFSQLLHFSSERNYKIQKYYWAISTETDTIHHDMPQPYIGIIADDFTGATDIGNSLVRNGMRCTLTVGVPDTDQPIPDTDALVVALKTRSVSRDEAVRQSLHARSWLEKQGVQVYYFKYCSTFDSTEEGNIGPVMDALVEELGVQQTVVAPAFPDNFRTVYQGHLFVRDRLLNESGMENHPLTPMKDANLVRFLGTQTAATIGLVPQAVISAGVEAVKVRIQELRDQHVAYVIVDTLNNSDLSVLAQAVGEFPFLTGSSALAEHLPEVYQTMERVVLRDDAAALEPTPGRKLILSGSCSTATQGQVQRFLKHHRGFHIDPLKLAHGSDHQEEALAFVRHAFSEDPDALEPVLVYASTDAATVLQAQEILGVDAAGALVENALASLAVSLVSEGVTQLIVAGGETSGAVVSALGVRHLRLGAQIDPGVPWTQTKINHVSHPISIALKSGNFGGQDFFTRAFEVLS